MARLFSPLPRVDFCFVTAAMPPYSVAGQPGRAKREAVAGPCLPFEEETSSSATGVLAKVARILLLIAASDSCTVASAAAADAESDCGALECSFFGCDIANGAAILQ